MGSRCRQLHGPQLPRLGGAQTTIDLPPIQRCVQVVFSSDEFVLVTKPYTPEYLALREAEILADMVRKHRDIPVDVLLVDGNGKFHSRGTIVSCHGSVRRSAKSLLLTVKAQCCGFRMRSRLSRGVSKQPSGDWNFEEL